MDGPYFDAAYFDPAYFDAFDHAHAVGTVTLDAPPSGVVTI